MEDDPADRSSGNRLRIRVIRFPRHAGGAGKPAVARDQRRIQRLGKGDIDGVVGREVVPQIPDSGQQDVVRIALDGHAGEVGHGLATALAIELSRAGVAAKNLGGLDIDEMRRGEGVARIEEPCRDSSGFVRVQEQFDEGRGIDDDHRLSRSCRIISAGGMEGLTLPRSAMRLRNSSTVGRAATSRISASKKSESDMPASAARALSVRCSDSGNVADLDHA